jgi:hypothetical protein
MIEPNFDIHHIFDDFETAQTFYATLIKDISLTEEELEMLKPPRQAHDGFWIIDRVKR